MLQLESETKARLRPWLFHHRLDLSENAAIRAQALSMAENIGPMKWLQKDDRHERCDARHVYSAIQGNRRDCPA
jgi:hypothetical protein